MLLLHRPPRLLLLCRQRLSLHFPVAAFARPGRRPTALRAEPEPQSPPPASAAASPDTTDDGGEEGPVELRAPTLFSVDDNPTSLQVATSVLLTGAISVFLFRSLRRRARRAKELVILLLTPSPVLLQRLATHHSSYAPFFTGAVGWRRGCGPAGWRSPRT
ncbi:hypothetical protein BRADI_3g11370v3 [Brachypodium distachyon]|uniref:Uncharacterized protein n=1 Tax=Brachypodium distachyon TaxID=15368 RepID=A0A0Q3F8K6_BRADI|nr:hypothetical protein BRADI_3g11370v3 [Brachypodium distachyon]